MAKKLDIRQSIIRQLAKKLLISMGSDFPRGLRDNTVITGREMNVYTMGLVLTTDNTQPNTTCGSAVQKVYHL